MGDLQNALLKISLDAEEMKVLGTDSRGDIMAPLSP